jgi:ferredoxin
MIRTEERTEKLRERVRALLSEGAIKFFIGYELGSDPLHVTPCFAEDEKGVETLVWNPMCINNLATYLKRYSDQRIGILVKGCDSRSIIELLKFNQIKRENLHIIGVPCTGVLDLKKVADKCDPRHIKAVNEEGGKIVITGTKTLEIDKDELLLDKCRSCAYPNPLIFDELVGDEVKAGTVDPEKRFADVAEMEELDPKDRSAFWKKQLNKCIRCYACKNVCPMCFCNECTLEKNDPVWVKKYPNPGDTFTFHMIRIYHVVGRCTGCLECERVCPMNIPLGTIHKKIEKDCLELFGYEAGVDLEAIPPLSTFEEEDPTHEGLLR